jgi:3-hydroxyacyl-CoA dehydrogenase / enoyl-CoA hydratase / 3-hydroxybutyryl-CoA epimerase
MSQAEQQPFASLRVDDAIAYICIDVGGQRVNTLSTPMTERFEQILDELGDTPALEGVVIHSGKPGNFVVGFDINELGELASQPQDIRPMIERGHELMSRFEQLSVPVVAAIDGNCLGGGLELAMACHARIPRRVDLVMNAPASIIVGHLEQPIELPLELAQVVWQAAAVFGNEG